jgi:hypothetical protein
MSVCTVGIYEETNVEEMSFACTIRLEGEIRNAKVVLVTFTTERKERTVLRWILWRCIARIGGGWNWHRIMSSGSLCCERC